MRYGKILTVISHQSTINSVELFQKELVLRLVSVCVNTNFEHCIRLG
jgi:hypothetical protein